MKKEFIRRPAVPSTNDSCPPQADGNFAKQFLTP
jgi:hypothetical protein